LDELVDGVLRAHVFELGKHAVVDGGLGRDPPARGGRKKCVHQQRRGVVRHGRQEPVDRAVDGFEVFGPLRLGQGHIDSELFSEGGNAPIHYLFSKHV
jgi:hypothetical protein